jgi:transposase-like protein
MAKRRHTAEQISGKLREAEILLAKGGKMPRVCRKLGVTEQTYYRWRKEYGGLRTDQAKRLKALEKENARLKKVVADLTLDNAILKEAETDRFGLNHRAATSCFRPSVSTMLWSWSECAGEPSTAG